MSTAAAAAFEELDEVEAHAPVKKAARRGPADPAMRRRACLLYASYCGFSARRWIFEGHLDNAYFCARLAWRNALKAEGMARRDS